MTVEEEFDTLVAPYARAAEEMGYRRLERSVHNNGEPATLWICLDFYFDGEATFLDLGAQIPRGHVPRHFVTGFSSIQFYTFIHVNGEDDCVLTNGSPPEQQHRRSERPPLAMVPFIPFINWVESRVPEYAKTLDMRDAADLPLVLERHRAAIAARRGGTVRKPDAADPLAQRWKWSEIFN